MDFQIILKVILAIAASMMLGAFWYSPKGFGNVWAKELNIDFSKDCKDMDMKKSMILEMCLKVINVLALYTILEMTGALTSLTQTLFVAGILSLGFSATTVGSAAIWEERSFKVFLITAGNVFCGAIIAALIMYFV